MYKGWILVIIILLFSPFLSAGKWSAGGIGFKLSVNEGDSDAFILISVESLDYAECPGINWSEDLISQCSISPSFHQTYVFYLNKSGVFLVGKYLVPIWFFYQNGSWIMVKTKDYWHYELYSLNMTLHCIYPLNRTIVGQREFIQTVRNSTVRIYGVLENDTVVFGSWRVPLKDIKPYLWLKEEVDHLIGIPLDDELLIYSPVDYWILTLKNGSFLLTSSPSSGLHISELKESIKPITIFVYDGKNLKPLSIYYIIYDVNTKKQEIEYVEGICVRDNIKFERCPKNISDTITVPNLRRKEWAHLTWLLIGVAGILLIYLRYRKKLKGET